MSALHVDLAGPHPDRWALQEVYAAALDDLEERWLGTRTHASTLAARRARIDLLVREWSFAHTIVIRPADLLVISSVS